MQWLVPAVGLVVFWSLLIWWINSVRYELRDDALCIVYGSFVMRRVPYDNIVDVRRGIALWNEHYNRLSRDPNITIRLRRGMIAKNLVINPPNTDEFIARLRSRLAVE